MSLVPPVLNPSSLYKEEAKRDATRIRIYNNVLSQIYNKIKAIARIPGNEKSLLYLVPEFIPGVPRFDIGYSIIYLVCNLRNTGYTVEYTHPNLLFITWRSYDEKYRETESPWSKVLINAKQNKIEPPVVQQPPPAKVIVAEAKPSEVVKRKTILKKTVEFRPTLDLHTKDSNITFVKETSVKPAEIPRLPGQLSEKHISFV